MTGQATALPPAVAFLLTRRLPCAGLATVMFMATVWLQGGAAAPPLGPLLTLPALLLHLATPALFALVFFGGGLLFALQVGMLTAALVGLLTWSALAAMLLLLLYAVLPLLVARSFVRPGGMARGIIHLALGLGLTVTVAMFLGAEAGDTSLEGFVDQLLAPWFEGLLAQQPPNIDAASFIQMVAELRRSTVLLFPAMLVLTLGVLWLGDVLLARGIARHYGFYGGTQANLLALAFDRRLVFVLVAGAGIVAISDGDVHYAATNALLVLAGLTAAQGLAVAHMWLQQRQLRLALLLLYIMLLIQPVMILPLVVLGVLDPWFDFRHLSSPASGG